MATAAKTMGKAEMRGAVEAFLQAWNDHDVDAIMERTAEDVVWETPLTPGPLAGKEAAAADVRATLASFPDLRFSVDDLQVFTTDDPHVAFSTWTLIATMTGSAVGMAPTGKRGHIRGVCVYRFQGGLIAEHRVVYDGLDLSQQLGLLPRQEDLSYKALAQFQRLSTKVRTLLHV